MAMIREGSRGGVTFGAAKLWRNPRSKEFYLLIRWRQHGQAQQSELCADLTQARLRNQVENLCARYGVDFIEHEEILHLGNQFS